MSIARQQCTIARCQAMAGIGYWSGNEVELEFRPADANTGITFVRYDCDPPARIAVHSDARVEAPLRTILEAGGERVEMVEHVLAALASQRIDNCEVWLNRPELPGMDGSAEAFVAAIDAAGRTQQRATTSRVTPLHTIRVGDERSWIQIESGNDDELIIDYDLDYGPATSIGRQRFELVVTPAAFRRELAAARTFILEEQAQAFVARGLGQHVRPQDLLIFGKDGPVDNQLRFEDECVRHKILDVIGDLALLGRELSGRITAYRSGHRLNGRLVQAVAQQLSNQQALHVA